jgi:hypothetical protein
LTPLSSPDSADLYKAGTPGVLRGPTGKKQLLTDMGLGVLTDTHLEHVPGTSVLNDKAPLGAGDVEAYQGYDERRLKHDRSGKTVLVPQVNLISRTKVNLKPSDSPNDPLNWPRWKKEVFTLTFAFGCGCVGGNSL